MRNYCTVFDKNHLVQGVALYISLRHHADELTLYALCMDGEACDLLAKASLPSLVPIEVSSLCTPYILKAKERTSHGQFCWVCQALGSGARQLNAQAIDYYQTDFKNVYYNRGSYCR